ncbi:TPR-like protein [Auricularia subglabra TFB-10046 SS5]|nr:TPR-like protein [Auricularia subglabra TFB-10046 SS5]
MSADSTALKDAGNALFREKKFDEAYLKYAEALEATTDATARAVILSNRAQCCISLKRWTDAKADATEALCADKSNHKAWLRLGRAYVGLHNFAEAIQLYEFAARVTQDRALASGLLAASRDAKKEQLSSTGDESAAPAPEAAARAVQLKEEGNALVSSKTPDFSAAFAKFSLAIAFDPSSAILYCNRAFCANNMKEWDTAIQNARRSISIDGAYVKAWARLGAAHLGKREFRESEDAFNHGLQLLESKGKDQPLLPADARLKASIEQSLQELARETRIVRGNNTQDPSTFPWILANGIINLSFNPADKSTWYSSAWAILPAASDFTKGVQCIYQQRIVGNRAAGSTGALQHLINAFTCDPRAFFVSQSDFFEKYKNQVQIEVAASKAFHVDKARPLLEAVKARLRADGGWGNFSTPTAPRRALATTIRAWFLNAFIGEKLAQDYDKSLLLYKHIVEFIELGRQEWATTPKSERGVIFELTFLLGVERIYIECLQGRYLSKLRMGVPDTGGILEQIKALAEKMLQQCSTFTDAERLPDSRERKPSHVLPFIFYPEAVANDALGFYYYRKTKASPTFDGDAMMATLRQSADHYGKAAGLYPKDDEMRAEALFQQLTSLFRCGTRLRETLPICDKLAQSIKDKQPIWRCSANSDNGKTDERYMRFVDFAEDVKKANAKSEITLDDPIVPQVMELMD